MAAADDLIAAARAELGATEYPAGKRCIRCGDNKPLESGFYRDGRK